MFIIALLIVLILAIAGYVGSALTVAVEAPVSSWERVSYWADRARYHETGPYAGWERGQYGAVRPCAMAHDVMGCTSECVMDEFATPLYEARGAREGSILDAIPND